MPFDPAFTSQSSPLTKRAPASAKDESVEMQIGRSDFALGERLCPFPKPGADAQEWHRGYDAEKARYPQPPLSSIKRRPVHFAKSLKGLA